MVRSFVGGLELIVSLLKSEDKEVYMMSFFVNKYYFQEVFTFVKHKDCCCRKHLETLFAA